MCGRPARLLTALCRGSWAAAAFRTSGLPFGDSQQALTGAWAAGTARSTCRRGRSFAMPASSRRWPPASCPAPPWTGTAAWRSQVRAAPSAVTCTSWVPQGWPSHGQAMIQQRPRLAPAAMASAPAACARTEGLTRTISPRRLPGVHPARPLRGRAQRRAPAGHPAQSPERAAPPGCRLACCPTCPVTAPVQQPCLNACMPTLPGTCRAR